MLSSVGVDAVQVLRTKRIDGSNTAEHSCLLPLRPKSREAYALVTCARPADYNARTYVTPRGYSGEIFLHDDNTGSLISDFELPRADSESYFFQNFICSYVCTLRLHCTLLHLLTPRPLLHLSCLLGAKPTWRSHPGFEDSGRIKSTCFFSFHFSFLWKFAFGQSLLFCSSQHRTTDDPSPPLWCYHRGKEESDELGEKER